MSDKNIETAELLYQGVKSLKIPVAEERLKLLFQYSLELNKWNRKINLIARNTPIHTSIEKHFLDSLTLAPVIKKYSPHNPSLIDIGSGAGFPGLVLKTVCPELAVTLVEPRQKRSTFLRHIIRTLNLDNVKVETHRIEDLNLTHKTNNFSFITSRALTKPAKFLPMIETLLTAETIIVFMQSQTDLNQWFTGKLQEQFTLLDHITLTLPFSKSQRQIILMRLR